jgi:neutral ceramidase
MGLDDAGIGVSGGREAVPGAAAAGGLRAGWAAVDFTPAEPAPLAGYTHWSDRMSTRVRDPLMVRALALHQGGEGVLLVAWDLLMVTEALFQGLRSRLADTGFHLMAHATHTHSSIGGYWDSWLARRFLGRYRPWAMRHLLDAAERAARAAIESMAPAQARAGSALLPGLNGNRRDPSGPKDEELTVLRLRREDADAVLVSYPAHPVIVAERDHHAISADFPGEMVRLLQRDFPFAMYVQGSLGGVDVLFPDDKSLPADRNLEMMAGPLASSAAALAHSCQPVGGTLAWAEEEWELGRPDSRPFYEDEGFKPLDWPLRTIANFLVRDVAPRGRVEGFRLGAFALLGFQADLGVGIGLGGKAHARRLGVLHPVMASQVNGYIGYLHLRHEYKAAPPGDPHLGMGRYENAMNFFGRGTGDRVLDAAKAVLDRTA